jgi:hypothetical protein
MKRKFEQWWSIIPPLSTKQATTSYLKWLNKTNKKTMTYGVGNSGPGLGQAQKLGEGGIPTPSDNWISNDNTECLLYISYILIRIRPNWSITSYIYSGTCAIQQLSFFYILWHPTKIYGPKVFLLTIIKPEYSDILYNPTHFPGPLMCWIRQVPLYYRLCFKIVISVKFWNE